MSDPGPPPGEKCPAPELSVVIPCFNEEQRLPASLPRIVEYLSRRSGDYEVLVVDDGSSDGTVLEARKAAAADRRIRVLSYSPNRGKGFAVAYGAMRASGRLVLVTDADLSTPLDEIEHLAAVLGPTCQVAIGSRGLPESDLRVRQPWWRECCGKFMNRLIRLASGLPYRDTQCGFKLFTAAAAADIFPNLTVRRWMFDVEVLVLARKLGYGIRDVPVTWENSAQSRVRLSHAPGMLRELAHIRWYWLHRSPVSRAQAELRKDAGAAG